MRILITGTSGFVAPHLIRYIQTLPLKHDIHGTAMNRSDITKIPAGVTIHECELKDSKNVDALIESVKPDVIFHLAAQSFVHTSWKSPADTLTNNIIGELNILEAARKHVPNCVVHIAGSSEEYGEPTSTPIYETHQLRPISPYGVSKVAQENLGYQYYKSYGLKVILTRAFNHTGPGRDARFAEASFAKQIAEAKDGDTIKVGNLSAVRDYTDVRDMVRAYWKATMSSAYGRPMNICSGNGIVIGEILNFYVKLSGKDIKIEQDPERMRPSDLKVLIGDCEEFKTVTDWKPEIKFEQTLKDIYEYFANS